MTPDDLQPKSIHMNFRQISDLPEIQKLQSRPDIIQALARIREFSDSNPQAVDMNNPLYHASLYAGLKNLDPEKGQGFGIWMQGKLKEAAHFALSRSTNPMTGQRYDDVSPTVYEMDAQFKKLAIFPDEASLYSFSVYQNNQNLNLSYQHMRQLLVAEGFDGIFLMKEQTVSAIVPDAISIKIEHDAIPPILTLSNQSWFPDLEEIRF